MILEIRHDIMGAFGRTYVEERTAYVDDEAVKIALSTLRKEKDAVLWLEEIGDVTDTNSITAVSVSWEMYADYDNKKALVTTYYGAGNISDSKYMEWNKARNYFKKIIKNG